MIFRPWQDYISTEEATSEPARAQILYERAVRAFPVNQDLWMKYAKYLENNLKVSSMRPSAIEINPNTTD